MKHNRLRLYVFLVLVGLLAVFASQSGATWADSGATPPIVPLVQPSATSQFNQAWQRAEKVGNYRYNTTIVQTTWPLPKLDNVGLSATEDRLYIEGETNLSAETMQMKLWSQGGNAASGQDSIEIKFEGDKAYGRVGQTDWQEMDSDAGVPTWSDLFAPDKDVLTYLQGATNIRNQGVEERAGIEFTRYTFDINGPKFAQYMRDQLQADLVSHGKLPPGLSLDLAEQYVEMQGRGELWVGQNSLPLRQVVHLKFPPAYLEQVEADITTDFSEWGDADFAERDTIGANRSPDSKSLGSMAMGYLTGLDWQKVSISAGLFAILSVLILLLISSRSRALYVGVSLTVIVSMLLTPLLQSQQVHAFYNEQQVQRNTYEAQRERQQMSREVQAELSNKDFDPHTDPLGEPAGSDQLAEGERSLSGSMDVDRLMPLLTATQIVTGTGVDSDGDGLGDADEALTCSRSDQADTDGDGLDDGTEVLELGTHPCQADSDSDLISDFIEVRGFKDESGRQWYLNPLDPDTNGDERLDSLDCSDLRNITASGQANPTSFDPPQRCADTDQDGTPDGFDFDDDNDGVPDSVDLAPTTAMGGGVKTGCVGLGEACVEPFPNQTFSFQASNLATDTPAFVDFQIRPQNPDHLWYTLNVLDWPHNDRQGQHQRVFTDTFGASGKDANGDMRLVPMLEIKIPYQAGHYNSLPVKATAPLVKPNLPTLTGKIYSDTQKLNTWLYGWLDKEATDRHGISVRVENRNGDLVVNVPLTLVRDKVGDSPVAMAGRMVYRPTDVNFGPSQQVRMVWAVYGLQDFCKPITDTFRVDLPQAERYDLWCQDTANWGTAQGVMHSYYDDWYLTGLTIQEDHGLKVGVVYENPAYQYPGQQPGYESNLWHVANGLQNTFVAGRTTTQAGVTARDITVDEIKHRFDITSTTTITERWQVPQQAMQVNVYPEPGRFAGDRYPDQSYIAEIPMTHTKTILQQYTGQAVSTTLLFVREEYYRTASLEEIGVGTKIQGVATQNSLNFNLDPAQFQQQVLAGMNWAPYHDTGAGGWKSYSIDEYWEQMDTIFNAIFMAEYPSSSPAANQGRVVLAQSFYLSLFSGASGIVQDGDNLLTLSPYKSDRDLSTSYLPAKAAGGLVKFIVKRAIKYTAEETALAAFARGEIKFGDIRHHLGTGWSIVIGVAVVAICAAIIVAATLTGGTTSEIIMSALIAIAFADAAITIVKASLAISQMQTLTNTITRASRIASIVGLIVVVAVTAGLFMYQMISASVRFGSVEFNQALAGAIATVIVATMMFAIAAIFPWGTLIVAIITVIDLLVTTICKLTDTEATKDPDDWEFWACSGINGMLTVLVQYLIYSNNPLVDLQAGGRLDIGNFSQRLITPTLGTSVGNQVAVSLDVISVLKRNKPNSWMGAVYMWHYLDDRYIEQSAFDYQLLPDKRSIDGPLSTSHTKDYWRDSSKGVVELRETVNYNNVVLGQAGINQRSALYLAEGYAINVQECFVTPPPLPPVPVCYLRDRADTLHIDVGDKLIFDIFPASLDEFYAMSDPEADGSYRLAWDSRFPALRDADGDGLRSRALGGNDPDDSSADADADGLSDYYEVYNNTNPTDADEDRDGLSDYQELIYNTNPHQADSDNDGLQDGEEVFHQTGLGLWVGGWEYTYGYDASDQPLKTLVIADPLNPDTDGDGYLDKQEQVYGFNPNVASVGSVLNVSSQLNDADGVVAPGATVVYSATIENDLRNRYALGLLDVDFPVAVQDESLDPQTFVLAEREQATVAGQVTVRPDLISSQRISLTNIAGAAIVNLRGDTNEQRNLWLHLNENVGATHFVDTSLLGHHGTCSGNTCPTAGQPGYAGHAVQFDGQDDYVQIPYAAALNPSNFSVAAWVKVMGSSFSHQSVLTLRDDYPQRGYILYVTPFNTWQFVLGDGSGWVDIDGGPVTIGEWTHLAAGYNASSETMRFYINGQLMVSRTNVSFAPNTQRPLRIGAGATEGAPQYHFNGLVDELEIYPRTLSDVEVAERFKESVFHVDFDGNVEDESAYRNSITCSGSRCPVVSDKKAVFDKQVHYDVASSANLDLSQGSGHFSLAAWIYPEGDTRDYTGAMDTWQAIFGNDQDKKNAYPTIWVNKEGKLKAGFGDGSQGLCSFESIAPILNLHQWNHILVTFGPAVLAQADLAESDIEPQSIDEQATSSGQLFKLYVNGQRIPGADLVGASACAGKSPPATNNFWIGRASQRASVHFNGVWTLDDHGDASGAAEHKLFLDGEALLPGGLHGVQEWTWYTFDKSRTISDDGQHTVVYCEDDTGNYSGCFGGDDRLLLLYFNNTVIGRHKSRWWGYGGELDWSVANDFYQGQIDDLSIYRYALTEDEAWDLYMGTVAYGRRLELRFDEPPGSAIFRDYSGNNLTGDCTGTTCPDTGIPGRSNQTARFDGEDDYVQIPYARELNPASFTVSAWVKVMGDSDSHRSVLTSRDDLPQKGYILYATPNDTWEFWVGDGTQWQIVGGTPVTLDVWTHLVARYDAASQTMNLYVNGQLAGSQAGVSLARNTRRPLRIGAGMTETSPPQFYFDGLIDQVIVYSRALSDAEIDDLTLARRLWLPLEESAGATQFSDASGSGYTGYCGGVTCPTMNVAGQTVGTAAQFDGINDYLWLDSYPPLAHASFTLAAWAKRGSNGTHDVIIGQGSQSRRRGLQFGFRDNNKFTCAFWDHDLNSPHTYTDNNWHHWACTYNASTGQRVLYRDGVLVAQDYAYSYYGSGTLLIGAFPGGRYFHGTLDDVMVYNRPLSDAEIINSMGSRIWLPLDESVGATQFADALGGARAGTCSGNTCPTAGVPGQVGTALQFDGVDDYVGIPLVTYAVDNVSLAAWVKWAGTTGAPQFIVNNGDTSSSGYGIFLEADSTLKVINGGVGYAASTVALSTGVWHHVAAVRENGVWRLYLDGVALSVSGNPSPLMPSGQTTIGANGLGGENFNGAIDEVEIYPRALDPIEIAGRFRESILHADVPVLNLHLDERLGATSFVNEADPANGGACGGAACPQAGVKGQMYQAVSFDGMNDPIAIPDTLALDLDHFSIGLWVQPIQERAVWQTLLHKDAVGARNYGLYMVPNSMQVQASVGLCGSGSLIHHNSMGSLIQNKWNHVVLIYDGEELSLYINGSLDSSRLVADTLCKNDVPITLGTLFSGQMDEVLIYSQALRGRDIAELYDYQASWFDTSYAHDITVDADKPSVALDMTATHVATAKGHVMAIHAADPTSNIDTVEYNANGQDWQSAIPDNKVWLFSITPTIEGAYTIQVRASDSVGNQSDPQSATFVVDGAGPDVTLDNVFTQQVLPAQTGISDQFSTQLAGTVSDPDPSATTSGSDVESLYVDVLTADGVSVNGRQFASLGSGRWQIDYVFSSPPNGRYTVQIETTDKVGNVTRITTTIRVDGTAPQADVTFTDGVTTTLAGVGVNAPTLQGTLNDLPYPSNPRLRLHFEESSGADTFYDTSGNQHTGVCTGAGCPTAGVAGEYGAAISLDGVDDYVQVDVGPMLDTSFTLVAWAKRALDGTFDIILGQGQDTPNEGLYFGFRDSNTFTCDFYNNNLDTPQAYTDTDWHHWACAYNAATGQRALYRDGILVAEDAPAPYQGSGELLIGRGPAGFYFEGVLDEMLIYDRALTSEQIRAIGNPAAAGASRLEISFQHARDTLTKLALSFEESAGATEFTDSLDNGHVATCSGDNCPAAGQPGKYGAALSFDGVDDYVEIPYATALNPASFSVSVWARVTGGGGYRSVLTSRDDPGPSGYMLYVDPGNIWQFSVGNGAGWTSIVTAPVTIDAWTHLVIGYDAVSQTMSFYVNGQLVGSQGGVSFAPNTQRPLRIGAGATEGAPQFYFNGLIDDVRIYRYALSADQVSTLANASQSDTLVWYPVSIDHNPPEVNPPVLNIAFEDDAGSTIFINSASGDHGSCTGEGCPSAGEAGYLGRALVFDGVDDSVETFARELSNASFSLSAWTRHDRSGADDMILAQGWWAVNQGLHVGFRANDTFTCGFFGNDLNTTQTYTDGDWHHWVCTYDAVTGRRAIYRDSALVAEDISPAHFQAPSHAFEIGKGLNLEYFEGALDEVRIYNDALALEEIQALYNWQSAIFATWNYSLPKGLEGPYHVDLRSVDRFSHTHTIPNVWTGEIDTLAPRASLTYNDLGDNTIQVQCTAQDYNLAKDGFVCPTGNSQLGRENQSAGWYTAIFSQTKLYRLSTPLQTVQGASNSMTACDLSGNCTMLTAAQNRPLRLAPTAVGLSLILTPTTHTVLTSTDPISIAGYALAQNYLQDLNLTVNASTVYTETYPSSTLTETVWETSWTPPAQGAFVLQATITDSLGTAITDTADNILYVDTTPPLISLTTTLITEQNFDQHGYISLSGLVTEAVGLQRLQAQVETVYTISLPSDAWQDIVLPSGAAWKGAVHSGSPKPPDGQLITLTLRAIDVAGQAATISRTILADAAPPAPVTVTLAYTNDLGTRTVLTPGTTIYDAGIVSPTLLITWTTANDGSGIARYLVGWTVTRTLSVGQIAGLLAHNPADRAHVQTVGEAEKLYAHVVAEDTFGNQTLQTLGPIYVDDARTPDYAALVGALDDGDVYRGWMESGCSLIGVDRRMSRRASALAALNAAQKFYATWDDDRLRLAWTGAKWDIDGDLFIYLSTPDTDAPVSLLAHHPYTPTRPITLPQPVNYLVWVRDSQTASLMSWDDVTLQWVENMSGTLVYRFDANLNTPHTDLSIPFATLGITNPISTSLGLLALASEEGNMRIWATAPVRNAVNSERATDSLQAALRSSGAYGNPTRAYNLQLGAQVCPSEGVFSEANVSARLSAKPVGYDIISYDDTWFDGPGGDIRRFSVGDGEDVVYRLDYVNPGVDMAANVTVVITASELQLHNAPAPVGDFVWRDVLTLGDIAPGASGQAFFRGTVAFNVNNTDEISGFVGVEAEVSYNTSAYVGEPVEAYQVFHRIDYAPPSYLEIVQPRNLIGPGINEVRGVVHDESFVPTITLQVQTPSGPTDTIVCPDTTPDDEFWSCNWDVGTAAANDNVFKLRHKATDRLGHVSQWTDWLTLTVDTQPATVTLYLQAEAALGDGLLSADEATLSGQLADNRLISGIEVCASDGQACESGQVTLDPDTILPTTFTYDDLPDSPIPVGSATSCLGGNLITRTFIVSDSFIVADVDLGFNTELIYRNTIVPTLQSPDGTQVILHYPLGYPTQNLDVMWDDAAMAVIFDEEADHDTASPYYEHARQPDERLNAFNGEQAQGTWSLVICDHFSLTDENGFYNRSRLVLSTNALPSDTRAGWRYDVPITSDYEGLTQSLHIYGLDSVGNRTTDPLSLTFRVDTAAPAITVTTWPSVPLVLSAPLHVDGIVSDGNGIQVMRLLGYAPNRQTLAGTAHVEAPSNVVMTGSLVLPPLMSDWTYTDTSPFVISGNYELWVEAVDLAGNQSTAGPFQVTMTKPPEPQLVYLPLVTRNYELSESVVEPDAPDLALGWDTVIASTDAVTPTTITIYNVGSLSVTTGFRVDLYFDPTTVPTTGQSWDSLSTYGGYWLVTDTVLAIEPYQTISLTLTDTFYQAAGSNYPDPAVFAGLTTAYIQLDTFDQVTETHELGDRYDNNIVRYIIQDWTDLR